MTIRGITALTRASFKGDVDCVKELIAAGADVNMGNCPPLTNAAQEGHLDCMNELLRAGADVNIKDKEGNTALIKAVIFCKDAILDLLLDNKAEINSENNEGETALYLAVSRGHKESGETDSKMKILEVFKKKPLDLQPLQKIVQTVLQAGAHLNDTSSGLNPASAHIKPT